MPVIQFFWFMLIAFIVALAARRFRVPYALALVISGMAIGVPRLLPHAHLDPVLLLTGFLPPILFESAINLRVDALRRDWKPIAIYTLAGTCLSTFIVGGIMSWLIHVPLPAGLVFGALISTTDPISIIGVFKRLGAGRRLTLIMEAESLFNNDTAVVLFTVVMAMAAGASFSPAAAVGKFIYLAAGGAALGLAIGAVASRVHYGIEDHLVEITLTSVVAFGSYQAAEQLHVSGVMAVIAAGLVIGNYGMPASMSPSTRLAVAAFWEYAAFVVNSIVFLLIGIEVAYIHWSNHIVEVGGAIFAVLAGRAAIYPLSVLVNRIGGNIPVAWQHVLYWGGLRGALSMALVLGLDERFPARETLVAATFGVVLFSLLAQGLTLAPLLRRLGLVGSGHVPAKDSVSAATEVVACNAALAELDRIRAAEAHPNWSVEMLAKDYRDRLAHALETLEASRPDHSRASAAHADQARSRALTAEKSALQEAVREGWLDESAWQIIAAQLDAELISLQSTRTDPPSA